MGSCCQKDSGRFGWDQENSIQFSKKPSKNMNMSQDNDSIRNCRQDNFKDDSLVPLLEKQLNVTTPTSEQLFEIISLLKAIQFSIPQEALMNEAKEVNDLLQKNPKYNLHEIMENFSTSTSQSKNRLESRFFYEIGNRMVKYQQRQWKQLRPQAIQELVRYQAIQQQVEKFTKAFYLKFLEIQDNTENIRQLFIQCFAKNKHILADQRFFTFGNGLKAAKFARQGSSSDKRGIYIFLSYLVRTIKDMEAHKMPLDQIEELVRFLIQNLSKIYPPGQDLVGGDENLKKTLKEIEIIWNKQLQSLQHNPLIQFKGQTDKRKVLEQQILKRATIAGQQLPYLNEIIRQTCLKKCIGVNSNLKLNAQVKNEKAIIRITEKILFKDQKKAEESENLLQSLDASEKDALEKKYQQDVKEKMIIKGKKCNERLEERLEKQQKKYQSSVEDQLKDKKELEFTISDMVRGKCTFSRIQDIIETIQKIKWYVKKQQMTDPKKFRILQIQSRFTKPIPISDITLKVALHERIVAELQLTLQNNVATYAFAHKIYELQRSKAFSKIKTVFNYYEEYKNQFQELVIGQLQLSESQKIQGVAQYVTKYFGLQKTGKKITLTKMLNETKYQSRVLNPQQKALVEAVFDRKMLKTNKQRAPLFRKYLKRGSFKQSSNPNTFTSVLFYQMTKDIDIPNNVDQICKQYYGISSYLRQQFLQNQREDVYHLPTIRTSLKSNQLDVLIWIGQQKADRSKSYQSELEKVYGNGQEMCEWLIQKGKIYDYISQYSEANNEYEKALGIIGDKGSEQLITNIKLSKAITLIKDRSFKNASEILYNIEPLYKEAKQYKSAAICTILLSQCALFQGDNEMFQKLYNETKQIVKLHKINFGGVRIANSQYRIGQKLLEQNPKDALNIHLRKAFQQYGGFLHVESLLKLMKENWGKYKEMGIEEPEFRKNLTITNIILNYHYISDDGCLYLSKLQWPNIQNIVFFQNNFGSEGCFHLSKAQWPNLQKISINLNSIGSEGCFHLSKAQWPNLQQIQLMFDNIGPEGCSHLSKANWPNLKKMSIGQNKIGSEGFSHLSQANWPSLQKINLTDSNISDDVCQNLIRTQWPNLQELCLLSNNISDKGCSHLSKAKWPNLQRLNLQQNNISDNGCSHLSKAKWPNLQWLYLRQNKISDGSLKGIKQLLKTAFPKANINL